jgi:GGDEF domain-containing protein
VSADAILVSLADLLRRRLRETDEIGRCGHHRFAVIMDRIGEADAFTLFRKLLDEFEAGNGDLKAIDRRSFRVVVAVESGDRNAAAFLQRAEDALRLAGTTDRLMAAVRAQEARSCVNSASGEPPIGEPTREERTFFKA